MLDRVCKEGDRISFEGYDGFVSEMGLRSIELTSLTGEKINLPNKDIVDKQIRNYSKDKLVRTLLSVGITYDNNRARIQFALKCLEDICASHTKVKRQQAYFKKFGDSTLDLEVVFWAEYATAADYNRLMTDLHLAIKEKFDAEGIEFAFPTQTLFLHKTG
jgi:MscS family membrane protein